MRARIAAAVLLGTALVLPAAAEASPKGGEPEFRRGRRAVPVRPAPRPAPRVEAPRPAPVRVSPRPAPRGTRSAPTFTRPSPSRGSDAGVPRGGQRVLVRGQDAPSVRTAPRSTPVLRSPSGDRSAREVPLRIGRDRASPVPDRTAAPRTVNGAFRTGGLPSGTNPSRRGGNDGVREVRPDSGTSPSRSIRTGVPGFLKSSGTPSRERTLPGTFGARSGGDGFVRSGGSPASAPSAGGGTGGSGLSVSGSAGPKSGATGYGYGPSGTDSWKHSNRYRDGFRNGYRVGYDDGLHDGSRHRHHYHDWYDRHRFHLSFSFALGSYCGLSYYWPYHHWTTGIDYAFFYPSRVTYCYVPFGFYHSYTPVYVTRSVYVREVVPVTEYVVRRTVYVEEAEEYVEAGPVLGDPDEELRTVEPVPAAGSPATEKFLREASDLFREGKYYEAAVKFRLAALSSPENPAPLFALGQALLAMGEDGYAARVLRKAVVANPAILEEPADISGVYGSPEEFDRVMKALEERAAASPVDGDARFLLGYQRFFTGDPRARETFSLLHEAVPEDAATGLFLDAVEKRFKAADELLPPLKK